MFGSEGTELLIKTIITHGKDAACDGTMSFQDGSTIAFCDIYTFNGNTKEAKIKTLTSYGVEI